MEFTQTEAKKKAADRQRLRTREEWIEGVGMPKGTWGQVIGADALGGVERATGHDIWVVHVTFPSEGVCICDMRKDRYREAFVEIASESQSSPAPFVSPTSTKKWAKAVVSRMDFFAFLRRPKKKKRPSLGEGRMSLRSALMGDGTFRLEVVGMASCQPELEELSDNPFLEEERIVLALLIPEDTNPYDPTAVRVQILGRTVGYLRRAEARALRACLGSEVQRTQRFRCRATIQRARFPTGGEKALWLVRLDVCLPQE